MTIDAHQHFWKYNPLRDTWITSEMSVIQKDFLPPDLEPELNRAKIEGCIAVQADQSEKETEFLLHLAREYPFIKGIVGWTDLRSGGAQARLEYYSQFDEVKGFRHIVQAEADEFLSRADFCNGISLLSMYNFTYDILVYANQLPAVVPFLKKFPNQKFVIDHLAKPFIKKKEINEWKRYMERISRFENVFCKVSGMVTEADWKNWKQGDFTPYLDFIFEVFKPSRIMYGSDWPVCLVAAGYQKQFEIVHDYINSLSPSEKKGVMGENARRFYHL